VKKELQKLGKKFPDHLQKSELIFRAEFYENKNILITQDKIGQSYSLLSQPRICQSLLKIPNATYPTVLLSGQVWSHHCWCDL